MSSVAGCKSGVRKIMSFISIPKQAKILYFSNFPLSATKSLNFFPYKNSATFGVIDF